MTATTPSPPPSQEDEALRRARAARPRTIAEIPRRDVRNAIAKNRRW